MLGRFVPDKHAPFARRREIRHLNGERDILDELFPGRAHGERRLGKLHPVIVHHGGVFPITKFGPVHDRHKADLRTPTGPCVTDIGSLVPVGQGKRVAVVEADSKRPVGCTLPPGDHPDTRIEGPVGGILQCCGVNQRRGQENETEAQTQ